MTESTVDPPGSRWGQGRLRWTATAALPVLRRGVWAAWCVLWGTATVLGRLARLLPLPPAVGVPVLALAMGVVGVVVLGRGRLPWIDALLSWSAALTTPHTAGAPVAPLPWATLAWSVGPVTVTGTAVPAIVLVGALFVVLTLAGGPTDAGTREVRALERAAAREAAAYARSQGHLPIDELRRRLALPRPDGGPAGAGLPLGYLPRGLGERGAVALAGRPEVAPARLCPCGLPGDADTGHLLVVGPPRSGKGFHQADSLLRWLGPAVAVDPKREQWARTAGWRARHVGPVYEVGAGGSGIDLADYYDLDAPRDRRELFELLFRPDQERPEHRIFTTRNAPLLDAAVATARATGEHTLAVLARWAQGGMVAVLREGAAHAPAAVATYTNDCSPDHLETLRDDRLITACWGTFTDKLGLLAGEIGALTVPPERGGVPADWTQQKATVYVTFPLHELAAAGPLVTALLMGLVRGLQRRPAAHRTLLSVDEAPAVALPRLPTWLATVGGAPTALTVAVYSQSVPDLERVYGRDETRAILSSCAHQVWFPPRGEPETGKVLSDLLGQRLVVERGATRGAQAGSRARGSASASPRYRPFLEPAQIMALPVGSVVCLSGGLRFLAEDSRTALLPGLDRLPPPPTPAREPATVAATSPAGAPAGEVHPGSTHTGPTVVTPRVSPPGAADPPPDPARPAETTPHEVAEAAPAARASKGAKRTPPAPSRDLWS